MPKITNEKLDFVYRLPNKKIQQSFGLAIAISRRMLGLKLKDLAKKTGYSVSQLSSYETHHRRPPKPSLRPKLYAALAKALKIDKKYLVDLAVSERAVLCPHCGKIVKESV